MSFVTICTALAHGGGRVVSATTDDVGRREAVYLTPHRTGPVYWRVIEPGRVDVASAPAGPWTAASHQITTQLDLAGTTVIDRERRQIMRQLDLSLTEARAAAGTATPTSLERARNRAKSGACGAIDELRLPTHTEAGRAGARDGMRRAIDHADAVTESWGDRAMTILVAVAQRGQPFTSPDVRQRAADLGLPLPPSNRAWGAVFRRAACAGLIRKTGRFLPYGDATTHTTDVAEWALA